MKRLLHHWVTEQAEKRPNAVALVHNQERMTYSELDNVSNQLARMLLVQGCTKGDRVCFAIPRSPRAIVAIIGILKAGCVYTPVDTSSPVERVAKILDSCQNRFFLAAGNVVSLLDSLFESHNRSMALGWLDNAPLQAGNVTPAFSWNEVIQETPEPLQGESEGSDLAYILFTSGSTGIPKGVMITHANVVHYIEWAKEYFGIVESDRVSGHTPLHFDLSVFDMFGAFSAGAELHLVPSGVHLLPNKLAEWIRASELTQWFSVPSVLNYMTKFDVVRFNDFPSLKRLMWCGEVLPTPR